MQFSHTKNHWSQTIQALNCIFCRWQRQKPMPKPLKKVIPVFSYLENKRGVSRYASWVCVFARCVRVRLDEFGPMCALLCVFVPICIANYFQRNSHGTRYFSLRVFFSFIPIIVAGVVRIVVVVVYLCDFLLVYLFFFLSYLDFNPFQKGSNFDKKKF